MWYEILPSVVAMYICLEGPRWLVPQITEAVTGSKHLRDLRSQFRRDMFHRDYKLTNGQAWRRDRLDLLPDEPEIK